MVTRINFTPENPPADGSQAWSWRNFSKLARSFENLLQALRASVGYGGMRITAPRAGGDITGTWQTLAPYDSETVTPYQCSFDITAGTFAINVAGVWRISLFTQVLVNNSGVVREAEFRLIDATTGDQIGATFLAEIQGRVLQLSFTGVYDLSAFVGIPVAMQVRSDDVISDVVWQQQNIGLDYAGPLQNQRNV